MRKIIKQKIDDYVPTGGNDNTQPVLRAFIQHLPKDGRANFLKQLSGLDTNQEIHDYAESLVNGVLNAMLRLRHIPPISIPHLKRNCLERDGSKCMITGQFEATLADYDDPNPRELPPKCAGILPFSLATTSTRKPWKDENEKCALEIIWKNLKTYFPSIEHEFLREEIDETWNAMTMTQEIHPSFGAFMFFLEETILPHTYSVEALYPRVFEAHPDLPVLVTFTCHNSRFRLPSPGLLKIHATLAKIFHASGIAGRALRSLSDLQMTNELSSDGTSDIAGMLSMTSIGVLGSSAIDMEKTSKNT